MSRKSRYATIICVAMAVSAFFWAYRLFNAPTKIILSDPSIETDSPATRGTVSRPSTNSAKDDSDEEMTETAASMADRINENTIVVYEYYYEDEDKKETASQKAPNALLNLTRQQLVNKIDGFSVVSFSQERVVLRKRIKQADESNYIIGVWDGYVAVFYGASGINETGLKEVTDTPVRSLSIDEQKRLEEGVAINSEKELIKILEDYGS